MKLKIKEISIIASLSAVSTITQLLHVGYQSPQFGMWIDVVAVSWLIGYFMYGFRITFLISAIGALMITFFAPETWLGAGMKWIATFPMFFIPALFLKIIDKPHSVFKSILFVIPPLCIALIVRSLFIIPVNYYIAIPIWTGMDTQTAIRTIPWYIITLFNSVQGILEVGSAWIFVYIFKLNRYMPQEKNDVHE